jgi:hypothetical protein
MPNVNEIRLLVSKMKHADGRTNGYEIPIMRSFCALRARNANISIRVQSPIIVNYEGVSKSFRTGHLE